jgi:AcrR family transcriptional regulator
VRQARSRATRERLLWAVERVVRERGLAGATVRAIAERAGVSVGTIYRRFPNKRALIETTGERFLERRRQWGLAVLRPTSWLNARASEVGRLRSYLGAALLEIERERPMLEAFARSSHPGPDVRAALDALVNPSGSRAVRRALDLILLALRGLVPAGSEPFDRQPRVGLASGWSFLALRRLEL